MLTIPLATLKTRREIRKSRVAINFLIFVYIG